MTLFFPHIPKCGGTTVKSFIAASKLNYFIDYDYPPSAFKFFDAQSKRRNSEFKQIDFSPFDLVYGHYPLKRYQHENRIILLLRHPVDRAVSHFNYFKHLMPRTNRTALDRNWTIEKIKDGEMGIIQFAKVNKLDHFYESYIGNIKPTDCVNVFFTDQLSDLFIFLNDTFELNLKEPEPERVNLSKSDVSLSEKEALGSFLSREIENYNLFLDYWKKKS